MIENEDTTTCFFIDCNGEGAQFVHSAADGVKVADILNPVYIPDDIVYNLFPINGVRNYQGISKPLLAAQVTELLDGVFIGCSINHVAADGTSFWHFFNTWSEISRTKSDKISQPNPVLGRQFLDGLIGLPIPTHFSHNEIPDKLIRQMFSNSLLQRVFHFSKEKVARLKAKANAEMRSNNMISSLQALMDHLWRAITRSRHRNPDQEVAYWLAVGSRQRLKPQLPKEYLGNALLSILVKSTAGELLEHGLGWAALEIKKMIASVTVEEMRKSLEDWVKIPIIRSNKRGPTSIGLLIIGSSPQFNVYGNDFGWGRPLAVRSGAADKFNGRLIVFPGAEQGNIGFEVCLLPQTLQAMADDAEFMETVT